MGSIVMALDWIDHDDGMSDVGHGMAWIESIILV